VDRTCSLVQGVEARLPVTQVQPIESVISPYRTCSFTIMGRNIIYVSPRAFFAALPRLFSRLLDLEGWRRLCWRTRGQERSLRPPTPLPPTPL
jgi:hypothetical protein